MDTRLGEYLKRTKVSAKEITKPSFRPQGIFTNAILKSRDVLLLIRDVDVHEKALFRVPEPDDVPKPMIREKTRRSMAPRRNTAVYSVLGGNMIEQLRQGGAGGLGGGIGGSRTDEVDVELLLRGAEKLVNVYHIPGTTRRIDIARDRYEQLMESIKLHEDLVEAQGSHLKLLTKEFDDMEEEKEKPNEDMVTEQMLIEEEEAINQLEMKKRELQAKIEAIDQKMSSIYRGT